MKALFITIPRRYGSTRLRVLNYFPYLQDMECTHLVGSPAWPIHRKIRFGLQALALARRHDLIFLHKLLLPTPLTLALSKLAPLVFDFDDAVYTDRPWHEGSGVGLSSRLLPTLRAAETVVVSTPELRQFATQHADNVFEIPTTLPKPTYDDLRDDIQPLDVQTIGWIGHPENLYFLMQRKQMVEQVLNATGARLRIITSDHPRMAPLENRGDVEYIEWSEKTADENLGACHCAIRPLPDTAWTRAKCHTSVIQPMALGLPVVTSPVGILPEILANDSGGFLADSTQEWVDSLKRILSNKELRDQLGRRAVERLGQIGFWTEIQAPTFRRALEETAK